MHRVGAAAHGGHDVRGLYTILHPMHESFAAIGLRPQLTVRGARNFEHDPQTPYGEIEADEWWRPQVMVARAWGAQDAAGTWNYGELPGTSRARGGVADGGLLLSPPRFEIEDYLLDTGADVELVTTQAFLALAPGVSLAFGTPAIAGGVEPKSAIIRQLPAATDIDRPLVVYIVDATGALQEMIRVDLDQATNAKTTTIAGTLAGTNVSAATIAASGAIDGGAFKVGGISGFSGTRVFLDADAQQHTVVVDGGIITSWGVA